MSKAGKLSFKTHRVDGNGSRVASGGFLYWTVNYVSHKHAILSASTFPGHLPPKLLAPGVEEINQMIELPGGLERSESIECRALPLLVPVLSVRGLLISTEWPRSSKLKT